MECNECKKIFLSTEHHTCDQNLETRGLIDPTKFTVNMPLDTNPANLMQLGNLSLYDGLRSTNLHGVSLEKIIEKLENDVSRGSSRYHESLASMRKLRKDYDSLQQKCSKLEKEHDLSKIDHKIQKDVNRNLRYMLDKAEAQE